MSLTSSSLACKIVSVELSVMQCATCACVLIPTHVLTTSVLNAALDSHGDAFQESTNAFVNHRSGRTDLR